MIKRLLNFFKNKIKMAKRLTRAEKEKQLVVDLMNEMFKIAGHEVTYQDIEGRQDAWYKQWTMTPAQYHEWLAWGTKLIAKRMRINKKWAEREMAMIGLNWGLMFDREPTPADFN